MPFLITCVMLTVAVVWAMIDMDTRKKVFTDKSNLPIYLFSVLILIVPLFYERYISALAGFGFVVTLLFSLFVKSIMDKSFFNKIMDVCCASSAICFIYSAVQKLALGTSFRATGGLLNANYYGTICEIVIIIAVYRLITNPKYKRFYISIIAINIVGIFLCDCQSAWIAVMLGVISLIFFSGHKKSGFIFLIICIFLIIIGIFTPGLLPRLDAMPQTFSTRMNIWATAIQGIKAHWLFGQGTLTYLFIYKLYDGYKTYHAHSLYLDPILNFGIVGVSIMLSYVAIMFRRVYLNRKRGLNKDIMAVVLAVVFAICVHGITDITVLWVQTGMLFLIVISGVFIKSENNC